jgi:formyl-CoA transferase
MPQPRSTPPLKDLVVLDLSRVLAGPYCTMMLADLGAQVIKVEQPKQGDGSRQWGPPWAGGESAYYLCVNRNKRSLTLNLKTERGREIVRELVSNVDVLIENWRYGTMKQWGLGYGALQKVNPGLVYCAITGYGQTGPHRERRGYDLLIQAHGGVMSVTGPVDGPPMKVGIAIVDITAGMFAAVSILAALQERLHSGRGQYIDISLFDSQIAWLANVGSNYLVSGQRPARHGNAHPNIVPYEPFPTGSGWIAVGVGTDPQWQSLCELAGWEDLATDPRFRTNALRVEHRDTLVPILQNRFQQRTSEEWQAALLEGGVPCAPINSIDRVFSDPQVLAREMVVEFPHPTAGRVRLAGSPMKFSRTPVRMQRPPPMLGEHTEEVLCEYLGYSAADVVRLRREGVV